MCHLLHCYTWHVGPLEAGRLTSAAASDTSRRLMRMLRTNALPGSTGMPQYPLLTTPTAASVPLELTARESFLWAVLFTSPGSRMMLSWVLGVKGAQATSSVN